MQIYFDKHGNLYHIEDSKQLKKKDQIDVYNEAGEEFSLPLKMADEFKLTEDEKIKAIGELKGKILQLAKALGLDRAVGPAISGGCPNIDPVDLGSILGTRIYPQQFALANLLQSMFGGGCPNIDPANLGSILGTIINPQYTATTAGLLNRALAGCPNIDPADIGSIGGTRINPQFQALANLLKVAIGSGCPNIDPVDLGSILGTRINPQQQLAAGLLRVMLGLG